MTVLILALAAAMIVTYTGWAPGATMDIVEVAKDQLGNVGGEPYWSWYGYNDHVEWCACFVSWCADRCGYIDSGIIPKFSSCSGGVRWFQDRGQWFAGDETPAPGWIIFFDWDSDGRADHTGIVASVRRGFILRGSVSVIEGNSDDVCMRNRYTIGDPWILGYGVPAY